MVGGVKALYAVLLALVMGVGCGKKEAESPKVSLNSPIVEKAIRKELKKPTGELTEADLGKVTKLDLTLSKITDAEIRELTKLKQLAKLWFGFTKITDVGLKEVTKLQRLEHLSLFSCKQITDKGLKELVNLKQLRALYLNLTNVSVAGVAELQKALPECEIEMKY